MPLVYLGAGWFIGIALASARRLPMELLLPAFLVPIVGFFLWRHDRRALNLVQRYCFCSWRILVHTVQPAPRSDFSVYYNGIGIVMLEG